MSDSDFESSEFAKYAAIMRQSESSNNYGDTENKTHLGAYQMSLQALQAANFKDKQGNWTALAKTYGVQSNVDFDESRQAQDAEFQNFTEDNFDLLRNFRKYLGKTVDGVQVSESGLLAATHLVGPDKTKVFLETDGTYVPHDKFGTSILKYMKLEGGLNFTFDNDRKTFAGAVNVPLHSEALQIGNQHSISVAPLARSPRLKAGPKTETHPAEPSGNGRDPRRHASTSPWFEKTQNTDETASSPTQSRHDDYGDLSTIQSQIFALGATALATSGLSLLPAVARNAMGPIAPIAIGVESPSMNAAFLRPAMAALTSFAPIRRRTGNRYATIHRSRDGDKPSTASNSVPTPAPNLGHSQMEQWQFSEMLSRELDAQARLPPSGATGFDPRLSPAWPGLKLPN